MSLILDALKRNTPKDDDESPQGDSRSDSVLATLGYPRQRPRKSGLSVKMLLVYGGAAVAIGFVGLSLVIAFFAPPEAPRPAPPVRVAAKAPAPTPSAPEFSDDFAPP